jgi:hypothetical protein
MRGFVLLIMLALVACKGAPTPPATGEVPELRGWELASGKPATQVEFAALVAACEDRESSGKLLYPPGGSLDSCLADLGLRRAEP